MEYINNKKNNNPLVSIILLDWSVRESFHSLGYLNNQSISREKYEIIWIEFYNRKPEELIKKAESGNIDKWIILGHSKDVYYHKHFMYNVGIIVSEGNICVICDSDAIFTPTFIESVLHAFEMDQNIVVHLDEIRNGNMKFYPFNYPKISDILGEGCLNYTGNTTIGLNNSPDMLHEANYGACFCALRKDLIEIGGADEHNDYLGYICGPYELTFRLINYGKREEWLKNEFLYHVWHPGESGNKNYGGPHDGRGISLRALEMRETGRVKPFKENPAIRELRNGSAKTTEELFLLLEKQNKKEWKNYNEDLNMIELPKLVEENYYGYNIILFKDMYFALAQDEGAFLYEKVINNEYRHCCYSESKAEVMKKIMLLESKNC